MIDRTKEPKLTVAEWSRLGRCERPCSKEEWRSMPNNRKWKTLENLGFLQQDEKKSEEEAPVEEKATDSDGQVRLPPQSAKPPPPTKPPSTYANDKPRLDSISETAEKGTIKGIGKEQGKVKGKSDTVAGKKGSKCSTGAHDEARTVNTQATRRKQRTGERRNSKKNWERDGGKITRDWDGSRANASMSTTVGRWDENQKKKKKAGHQVEDGRHMGMSNGSRGEVGIAY